MLDGILPPLLNVLSVQPAITLKKEQLSVRLVLLVPTLLNQVLLVACHHLQEPMLTRRVLLIPLSVLKDISVPRELSLQSDVLPVLTVLLALLRKFLAQSEPIIPMLR